MEETMLEPTVPHESATLTSGTRPRKGTIRGLVTAAGGLAMLIGSLVWWSSVSFGSNRRLPARLGAAHVSLQGLALTAGKVALGVGIALALIGLLMWAASSPALRAVLAGAAIAGALIGGAFAVISWGQPNGAVTAAVHHVIGDRSQRARTDRRIRGPVAGGQDIPAILARHGITASVSPEPGLFLAVAGGVAALGGGLGALAGLGSALGPATGTAPDPERPQG
jgi:hypothetical protein